MPTVKRRARLPEVMAAVDLGSNSFHMIVARHADGRLVVIDRMREMVRLAAGLGDDGGLTREAQARAIRCLERFGQRLRDVRAAGVRVVGTNTLRRAKNKRDFLDRARRALGHRIEIISGIEEARLIYLGVAHSLPSEPGRRLVIDIGGGSTELIIGEGYNPRFLESLHLGCVSMSLAHFPEGRVSAKRFERARVVAQMELESIEQAYRRIGWEHAVGSSGSVRAVFDAIRDLDPRATTITRAGLDELAERLIGAGSVAAAGFGSISPERAPVFTGGLAILTQVFESLGLETLRVADGALREGLLYDMLGRLTDEDVRARTVRALESRFHVDAKQADRVESTAVALWKQVAERWGLDNDEAETALRWAARLHEIGLDISHAHHHRHGAYLLEHADLSGFTREEQRLLACIVAGHRRKPNLDRAASLPPPWNERAEFLVVLLRIAVLLHRSRSEAPLSGRLKLGIRGRTLSLKFPRGWLKANPLTGADLAQEAEYLASIRFRLTFE